MFRRLSAVVAAWFAIGVCHAATTSIIVELQGDPAAVYKAKGSSRVRASAMRRRWATTRSRRSRLAPFLNPPAPLTRTTSCVILRET